MDAARRVCEGSAEDSAPIIEHDFAELPAPVSAYLRRAVTVGQSFTTRLQAEQEGVLLLGDRWRPFKATQYMSAMPPGFVWDAHIRMAPLFTTYVRDSYIAGIASMRASLTGLFDIVEERGGDALNAGALQRYLAEATWMPVALLPRNGVKWTAVDDTRALATLSDAGTTVFLEFTFNAAGEVIRIFTPARPRAVDGRYEPTPWSGRFWNYAKRAGMWIPLEGEVAWQIAGTWQPWWRGRIVQLTAN